MNDPKPAGTALALPDNELIEVLQASLYPGAKKESVVMVIGYCRASGLDPMLKPVHIVPMSVKAGKDAQGKDIYEQRDVIMPGVNLYRTQAAETGLYCGMTEPEWGPMKKLTVQGETGPFELQGFEYPEWCKITVYRSMGNGEKASFTAIEYWEENYAPAKRGSDVPNEMWKRRPRGQLAKCTEAQALRKAFPERTGAPTAEELAGKSIDDPNVIDVTARERSEPQRRPAAEQAAAPATGGSPSKGASSPAPAAQAVDMTGERKWAENKLKQTGKDLAPILAEAGIESLDQLTPDSFAIVKRMLTE